MLGYLKFRLSILTVMWMQLTSLNKVIFEDHIFTFKYATNGNDLFSIVTSSLGNKFFDNTHLIGRPFWCQNNENVAQVLDNNRIKPSQNTFFAIILSLDMVAVTSGATRSCLGTQFHL